MKLSYILLLATATLAFAQANEPVTAKLPNGKVIRLPPPKKAQAYEGVTIKLPAQKVFRLQPPRVMANAKMETAHHEKAATVNDALFKKPWSNAISPSRVRRGNAVMEAAEQAAHALTTKDLRNRRGPGVHAEMEAAEAEKHKGHKKERRTPTMEAAEQAQGPSKAERLRKERANNRGHA